MTVRPDTRTPPDFTQPIALMMDCHRRIEHFLETLCDVVARNTDGVSADEDLHAAQTALNYFRRAAPRHTADEEESLFPRMRRSTHPEIRKTFADLESLDADHRRAEDVHAQLDKIGQRWIATNRLEPTDRSSLITLLDELSAAYTTHIRLEDERVYAIAAQHLSEADLLAIGEEMAARRVEDPGREGSRCAERRLGLQATDPGSWPDSRER